MLASCSGEFPPPALEQVPLAAATGRILAVDLHLDRDEPPVSRSAMDGFALRSADADAPRRILGTLYAGTAGQPELGEGEAFAVMTGGTVPTGADAVVPVERTVREGEELRIDGPPKPGQHVRQAGEMGQVGQRVLAAGTRLGAGDLAVAASVGAAEVTVLVAPRVAVFATGDEVVSYDTTPEPHQVRDSNGITCAALLEAAGAAVTEVGHLPDEREALATTLGAALAAHPLVVTIGGVSMGEKDYLPEVFAELGVERILHKANIQPGKPLWLGRHPGGLVLGLPGNPVSGYIILSLFAPAALAVLSGREPAAPWRRPARATTPMTSGPRERFVPVRLTAPAAGDALPRLSPTATTGSGDWSSLAAFDALAYLPPRAELAPGDEVGYYPLLLQP